MQNSLCLLDFLNQQEVILNEDKINPKPIEQLIELKARIANTEEDKESEMQNNQSAKLLYYNVKTIKVVWDNNQNSYLHVFIDTSQIKKLEEEKANNKCQQLMFASISHELRTPLNAFINSLQLIDMTIAEMRKKISKFKEAAAIVDSLYPNFEKFFKVGEISSKLLMVLVEDVLDMVKFSINTFSLDLDTFSLKDILSEVSYIYDFQCRQKHLKFSID